MAPKQIEKFTHKDIGLSDDEYEKLKQLALKHQGRAWDSGSANSPLNEEEKKLVTKFKQELKEYLYHYCPDVVKSKHCKLL